MSTIQNQFNVTSINVNSVYNDIKTYLNKVENKNANSHRAYERNIKRFFMWMCNKNLNQLTIEDLKVRNAKVEEYKQHLIDTDLQNTSINSMMGAIVSLYTFLERQDDYREFGISTKSVEVDRLPEDAQSYGNLEEGEAQLIAQEARNHKMKGYEKYLLFKFAYTTSLRQSAILNVEWTDFTYHKDNDLYVVNVMEKGSKRHKVSIPKELYNELLLIKKEKHYKHVTDDKVFHLSIKTIQSTFDDIMKKLNIDPERNIKFHSLRSVASLYGTLEELKRQLNHSNINTTMKHYRHTNEDYSTMISMRMEEKLDDTILTSLSQEKLLQLIMSQDQGLINKLKREANSMFN